MSNHFLEKTRGGLIVSCQALPGEPLHSSYIMSRMAVAAEAGGACGLRANSVSDILEIRKTVSLPMIGIIKQTYPDSDVFITPTLQEIADLYETGVEVIAMDATQRRRPKGQTLPFILKECRKQFQDVLFMADCSTFEDAVFANRLGFDIISTTLHGYTEETANIQLPDLMLLQKMCKLFQRPVIAEGGIWDPATLSAIMDITNIHAAVIGSAITRPLEITRRFVSAITPAAGGVK